MRNDSPRDTDSFETTHWSVVLEACRDRSEEAGAAFARLCETYWYPLYAYARRRVRNAEEAEDFTQGFFAELLDKRPLASASPERGRFRAFLLTAFRRFLSRARERSGAQKRGGGRKPLSLDLASAESRFRDVAADTLTPDKLFDREWAAALLDRVTVLLRDECERSGKGRLWEELKGFLAGRQPSSGYAEAGAALGISEGAAAIAAHRLRARYRQLLRAEVARTVSDRTEVEDEIRDLFEILSR